MQLTDSRPVIHPPIPEREVDPSTLDNHVPLLEGTPPNATLVSQPNNGDFGEGQTSSPPNRDHDVESWRGARTSKVRPTIASIRGRSQAVTLNGANGHRSNGHARYEDTKKDVNAFLYARVLNVEDVKRPEDLVRPLEGVEKAAEVVWILRPLLYGKSNCNPSSFIVVQNLVQNRSTSRSSRHQAIRGPSSDSLLALARGRASRTCPASEARQGYPTRCIKSGKE